MDTTDETAGRLEALLKRLQAGDESAKSEVIWYSCQRLMSLVGKMMRRYRRLQRWEELDDVFQDATLRLYRSQSDVKPESIAEFFALAATQIRRTLIDLARRHFGPEGPGSYQHLDVDAASDEPVSPEQWTEFYEVLDTLPKEERAVVDLLWFDGLTQAEAAIALGVSERSIRRRWFSARYFLFKALGHES